MASLNSPALRRRLDALTDAVRERIERRQRMREYAAAAATLRAALTAAGIDPAQNSGLREFGYSWADIAGRLGVTRQAAQQRWGDPADRGAVDARLLNAGLDVTVPLLVTLFADHYPGKPAAATCPGCGHVYSEDEDDCPTNTVVRPLLYRRRNENKSALSRLTPLQHEDLMTPPATSRERRAVARPVRAPGLFD